MALKYALYGSNVFIKTSENNFTRLSHEEFNKDYLILRPDKFTTSNEIQKEITDELQKTKKFMETKPEEVKPVETKPIEVKPVLQEVTILLESLYHPWKVPPATTKPIPTNTFAYFTGVRQLNGELITGKGVIYELRRDAPDYKRVLYEGEILNGCEHGYGKYRENNGTVFECNFVNGKRQGDGKFTNKNVSFVGVFNDNDSAFGIMQFNNGDVYEGEIYDKSPSGRGVMMYKNFNTFDGNFTYGYWRNGMKNGYHRSYHKNYTMNSAMYMKQNWESGLLKNIEPANTCNLCAYHDDLEKKYYNLLIDEIAINY